MTEPTEPATGRREVWDVPGVDELFALDPSEFTRARDAVAARVKQEGHRELAVQVKKLPRPTKLAWAVNQAARRDPSAVQDLLEATAAVRDAQVAALQTGERAALRDAVTARRDLIRALADTATAAAGGSDRSAAAAMIDAATLDPELAQQLRAGRLTKTLDPPSGFGLAEMPEPAADGTPQGPDRGTIERLEREVREAERRTAQVREQLHEAEQRVAEATQKADAARSELEQAQQEQHQLAAELADATRQSG